MKKNIIVLGSGLAGSLLCNELSKNHDVTLLEKGQQNSITYPQLHFHHKKLAEVHTCCYGGGGSTNLWHNGLIPIKSEDVVGSEFREVIHQAQAYIDQTAAALFYTNASFTKNHQKLVAETNSLLPTPHSPPQGIDCLVYPKKYHKLSVVPAVNAIYDVTDINFGWQDGRISKVTYQVAGELQELEPDVVIVSAGTLGTPALIQRVVRSAGKSDKTVGVGFIDHPMGFVGKVKVKGEYSAAMKKLSAWDRGDYISRSAIRLKSPCGRYTACAFLRPALTMDNRLEIYKYKSGLGASSGMERIKAMFSWKLLHPDIIAEIVAHLTGKPLPSRTYNILLIADQKRGTNRVYEKDGKIHVDWQVTDEEIAVYRTMLVDLKNMLTDKADDININTEITSDWLWSAAHHSGTISMGTGEGALVDTNLKLKCCDNVYVCDGSVLQEHSYANTGLAIGQLAFRLADHLNNKTLPRAEHAEGAEKS